MPIALSSWTPFPSATRPTGRSMASRSVTWPTGPFDDGSPRPSTRRCTTLGPNTPFELARRRKVGTPLAPLSTIPPSSRFLFYSHPLSPVLPLLCPQYFPLPQYHANPLLSISHDRKNQDHVRSPVSNHFMATRSPRQRARFFLLQFSSLFSTFLPQFFLLFYSDASSTASNLSTSYLVEGRGRPGVGTTTYTGS